MNSADKRQDTGDGMLLGMEKTVEHIFAQVPTTGLYSIWVQHVGQFEDETGQYYGLAWWTLAVPEPSAYVLLLLGVAALAVRTWASRSACAEHPGAASM